MSVLTGEHGPLEHWPRSPADGARHCEPVGGVPRANRKTPACHRAATFELGHQLRAQLPRQLCVLLEVEVVTRPHPATVRVPDLVVVPRAVARRNPVRYPAFDVALAVELLPAGADPGGRRARIAEYAAAGIRGYWTVELAGGPRLTAYRLADTGYRPEAEGSGTLVLDVPVPVTLELDRLCR
ncbi:putative restriction endonuclease [Amycolatopsis cihanbeyliensis]|uniref:Putative restriction endonuclease n=2 Tax=Amycolatopsis cihanbeyliensis TaxID=1128664 RepID=A0A542DKE3_AMYCI|nr:putative restriction endonuclease [Amycolatopsis cihanbeyliensis]